MIYSTNVKHWLLYCNYQTPTVLKTCNNSFNEIVRVHYLEKMLVCNWIIMAKLRNIYLSVAVHLYYIILETIILINFFICICFPKYSYATTLYDNFSDKYISVPQSWSVTRTSLGVFNICSIPGVTRPQKSITMVEASLWFSLSMGYWAAVDSQYMVHNYRYNGTQISHSQYMVHSDTNQSFYCDIFTSSIS